MRAFSQPPQLPFFHSSCCSLRSPPLPSLRPAIASGCGLAFARALGEFGSVVLLSGNIPFRTEVASVFVFGRVAEIPIWPN